jgi:hypothetical protein
MSVSGVYNISSIASLATQMKAENVQLQLSVAVLKKFEDMQKVMGEALVEMIQATPAASGDLGQMIDIQV